MRKLALVAAVALAGVATSADAATVFTGAYISADGVQTRDVYNRDCGGIGFCSTTVTNVTANFQLFLNDTVEILDGTFSFSGYDMNRQIFGGVTLTFRDGALLTSSFTGQSQFVSGTVPGDFTDTRTRYTDTNFAVSVYDTVTRSDRIIAPIPEPSTWAMLLLGFAGIGTAMRRTNRLAARSKAPSTRMA